MSFPFESTSVIAVAAYCLVIGLLAFVFMLLNRVRRIIKRMKFQQTMPIRLPQHIFRFLVVLIWIMSSAAVLFLAAFVQSFQAFTKKQLVAEVACRPLEGEPQTMLLEISEVIGGVRQQPKGFVLKGDQWSVEGDILKWDDWLNFAGMHTQYKLTRVRGRYIEVEDERAKENTVYSLVTHESDPRWSWLYKYGYRLRFVDAAYGNTVFTYPSDHTEFLLYVTTSGLSLTPRQARAGSSQQLPDPDQLD